MSVHPQTLSSLAEILYHRSLQHPHRIAYTFLLDDHTEESLTCRELHERALSTAHQLLKQARPGDRALLLYHPGLEFIVAFMGCLYAGMVAVPAYPPQSPRYLSRIVAIMNNAGAKLALTTENVLNGLLLRTKKDALPSDLVWITTDSIPSSDQHVMLPYVSPEALAFLQYTSGSTGAPKGVMVTNANLMRNSEAIKNKFQMHEGTTVVGWLPLYHDMGLIGNVLQPLFTGCHCVLLSHVSFLQRPMRWLEAITRYKGTASGAPDFAYSLCVDKISEEQRKSLDLSSWDLAYCGAEPVKASTIERFVKAFTPCGFSRKAFYPCYGLAEATLFVSGGIRHQPPVVLSFDADSIQQQQVKEADASAPGSRSLVSCGQAAENEIIVIADPATMRPCPPGQVGEIWLAGPSITKGYWNEPAVTNKTFHAFLDVTDNTGIHRGPYMRTGDLGFMYAKELFVTGRLKDIIIIRGRNHYPQDIEYTVENSHPVLHTGRAAAFTVEADEDQQLVIVQEINRHYMKGFAAGEVMGAIREAVAQEHGLQVQAVVLIKPSSIPKTSSGKIQRHQCKIQFAEGGLEVVHQWQLQQIPQSNQSITKNSAASKAHFVQSLRCCTTRAERDEFLAGYVRNLVAEVLGYSGDELEEHQPLSRMGIDSLMSVRLQNQLETIADISVPLVTILDGLTVNGITKLLSEKFDAKKTLNGSQIYLDVTHAHQNGNGNGNGNGHTNGNGNGNGYANGNGNGNGHGAVHTDQKTPFINDSPLSFGQRGLWLIQQLTPENPAYNVSFAADIRGPLDAVVLKKCFQAMVDRHPSLRTTFPVKADQPVQHVAKKMQVHFEEIDTAAYGDDAIRELLSTHANTSFDLELGPLFKVCLMKLSKDHYVLQVIV
ncbi:MAG: AMP-binding protein, partial [Chitinophagaceae bacterium]